MKKVNNPIVQSVKKAVEQKPIRRMYIDSRTGLVTECNPREKGDGEISTKGASI